MRILKIIFVMLVLIFTFFTQVSNAKNYKMLSANEFFIPISSNDSKLIHINFNNIAKKESSFSIKFTQFFPDYWRVKACFKGLCIQKESNTEIIKNEEQDTLELRISAPDKIENNKEFTSKLKIGSLREVSISDVINLYVYTTEKKILNLWVTENIALINNVEYVLEAPIVIRNERIMVPLRFISNALGMEIFWDEEEKKVDCKLSKQNISFWINSNIAEKIIGNEITRYELDSFPIIINDRTYVPVRFISEAFGAVVSWNGLEKRVKIEYPANDIIPDDNNLYYSDIYPETLENLIIQKENIKIIDVRYNDEFILGHIPNSINIPLKTIKEDIINSIDIKKDSQIVVYCSDGERSTQVAEILVNLGYSNVRDLIGGINSWKYEIEK
jgi:rhodanese-related sulfurtransferase